MGLLCYKIGLCCLLISLPIAAMPLVLYNTNYFIKLCEKHLGTQYAEYCDERSEFIPFLITTVIALTLGQISGFCMTLSYFAKYNCISILISCCWVPLVLIIFAHQCCPCWISIIILHNISNLMFEQRPYLEGYYRKKSKNDAITDTTYTIISQ